jgi:hypothetical protein
MTSIVSGEKNNRHKDSFFSAMENVHSTPCLTLKLMGSVTFDQVTSMQFI